MIELAITIVITWRRIVGRSVVKERVAVGMDWDVSTEIVQCCGGLEA